MTAPTRTQWLVATAILTAVTAIFAAYQNPLLAIYLTAWSLC